MIYLYTFTNHKENLDSLRRVLAIYDELKKDNLEVEILVNEFRAQLLAREWGYPLATTIETIKDIDAVAPNDATVIIDSPEELECKVLDYPDYFKKVIYINSSCNEIEYKGAKVVNLFKDGVIVPNIESKKSIDRVAYIYGDSDFDKTIIKNLDFFKNLSVEIDFYWGVYFFVKYEDEVKKAFSNIIEEGEYYDILKEYKYILTSNIQVALEAANSGAKLAFLDLNNSLKECEKEYLEKLNINIFNKNDKILFKEINKNNLLNSSNIIKNYV